MKTKATVTLASIGVGIIVAAVVLVSLMGVVRIEGNQMGVKENWRGVVDKPLTDGMHIYFRPTQKIIVYDMNSQVFVMNDLSTDDGEVGTGRVRDSYQVQLKGGMDAWFSIRESWHRNPTSIIDHHKNVRENCEELVIRKIIQRVVKDEATIQSPLDVYAGQGLVNLQNAIDKALSNHPEFIEKGVEHEIFVLEGIRLDTDYVAEIKLKQVQVQRAIRLEEETKANLKEAEAAEAKAQIEYKKQVVDAERSKAVGILQMEKEARQAVLTAEAEKARNVLEAEGQRDADLARASGIKAKGLAEAEVEMAKRDAMYAGEAGERRAQVEIWGSKVGVLSSIKGVLPEGITQVLIDYALADTIRAAVAK